MHRNEGNLPISLCIYLFLDSSPLFPHDLPPSEDPLPGRIWPDSHSEKDMNLQGHIFCLCTQCTPFDGGRKMDCQPPESQKSVNASNETISAALKCTTFVLRQARELAPDQQKRMLAIVGALIALEREQDDLMI
jgi:hypothetical protein